VTSKNRNWKNFKETYLYNYLLKSFFLTYNDEYNYTFYFGIDEDDEFFSNNSNLKDIENFVKIMKNSSCNFETFNIGYKGKPCWIWNRLYEKALNDNDYFVQCGDDVVFMDKNWVECAINGLKEMNDIGVVGLTDEGRRKFNSNDTLITQTMVSQRHYEIFNFYFPLELTSWCSDNWIGDVYNIYGKKRIINQRIINCGGEPRYDVPIDYTLQYQKCMMKYKKKISKYQAQFNFFKLKR
jgi:hypothetical protein